MTNNNFFALLKSRFDKAPDAPCLTMPDGQRITYGEMDARSASMAGALLEAGAQPGDRVLVQVDKSPDNVALYLGAMRAGIVYVPLNTAYTASEVSYFIEDADPAVFICTPARQSACRDIARQSTVLTLDADAGGELAAAALKAAPFNGVKQCASGELASILYTSGTTGRAKGAMLSHGNLAANALTLHHLWGYRDTDVLLHALPIFHIHGLFVALHTAMLNGSEMLFLPKFSVDDIRKAMPCATIMMGAPTFYTRLLADTGFSKTDSANMRLFISGSAPLSQETFNAFEQRTGHKILERYGMSEAGMIASNPLDGERIAGTVGFALPGVDVRIAGDDGAPAAANQPGIVEVKGPNIFKGYWRNPAKTSEDFTSDKYFKTGDIGVLDEDQRLSLVGRAKDLIIAGGYNIYPKEIEQVLDAAPGIVESAVIGAPHPDMGEGVVAVLVADSDPVSDKLMAQTLSRLARFKRPRAFFWINALPRNDMGKVQKQVLRERYASAFE